MRLRDFDWRIRYRSADQNLLEDFYIPALKRSSLYQRAAGYFSTASLMIAARGIVYLIKSGGKMQLVVSPYFSEQDIRAIEDGYKKKDQVINEALERQFPNTEEDFVKKRLEAVSWMIANNQLDIKIAYPAENGKIKRGIYHEKMAVFTDVEGDYLTCSGSNNESEDAYIYNFESFDVQFSWESGWSERLARMKKQEFDDLWKCNTKNLEIMPMPEAIKERLLKTRPLSLPTDDPEEKPAGKSGKKNSEISLPSGLKLRPHQEMVITNWFNNGGRGVIEHATGSGKTITALSLSARLLEKLGSLAIIILCPQKHLVDQWNIEAKKFGANPILGYEDSTKWYPELNRVVITLNMGMKKTFVFITTNKSFTLPKTQEIIRALQSNLLIIGDEVHNLGAPYLREGLIDNAKFRLGLSATPERWYDEEGTSVIYNYFGKKLEPVYGIREAIKDGYLCSYRYFPHLVTLTAEENDEYHLLTEKIGKYSYYGKLHEDADDSTSGLSKLLFERARLLGTAINKLNVLKEVVNAYSDTFFNLFYCGDGKIEDERQIDKVCRLLGHDIRMRIAPFTYNEKAAERTLLLEKFVQGDLQGLVAIRCLDEGLDVPSIQRAFILASSTNPRQFIQRRGRILRNSKQDKIKIAEIHDFIVIPSDVLSINQKKANIFNTERNLLKKELQRFAEFADTAKNGPQAHEVILEIKKAYNLLDM